MISMFPHPIMDCDQYDTVEEYFGKGLDARGVIAACESQGMSRADAIIFTASYIHIEYLCELDNESRALGITDAEQERYFGKDRWRSTPSLTQEGIPKVMEHFDLSATTCNTCGCEILGEDSDYLTEFPYYYCGLCL